MTGKQPRFSRRFLTILMMVTAMAILLLSRLQPPAEQPQTDRAAEQQATETDR